VAFVQIILASASPRRAQLLAAMGLTLAIAPADVDETMLPGEAPAVMACRLAASKAQRDAQLWPEALVLAADTLVVLDGIVLGKPRDAQEALEMLTLLRGREHLVHTGLAVARDGEIVVQLATSPVSMRSYSAAEIAAYIATGDPLDKAGAYACQHPDFHPVASYGNCYANVMGLPLCHVQRLLTHWGVAAPRPPLEACPWAVAHRGCQWAAAILEADRSAWPGCGA
jgi:MAF protein